MKASTTGHTTIATAVLSIRKEEQDQPLITAIPILHAAPTQLQEAPDSAVEEVVLAVEVLVVAVEPPAGAVVEDDKSEQPDR